MIGIIGALDIEVEAIVQTMSNVKKIEVLSVLFHTGEIDGKEVAVALSGVGKVNAALTTTVFISHFQPTNIINVGTAGGLLEEQNVLDVVVSDTLVQHDFDTSDVDGEEGLGIYAHCDEGLIQLSKQLLQKEEGHKVWIGQIATGDQFISKMERIEKIKQTYPNAIACEMEAAAVAEVANRLNTKCIVVRSLSDNPYHPESHMEFREYAKAASKRSAQYCKSLITLLD